jgi:hypothetical protein
MSDFTSKSCGDLIVCGVSADEVIEDLGKIIPKSVATHIPAENAHKSKDLWRLLSQSRLIRLNVNPLLKYPTASTPTLASEGVEILQTEYNKAVSEIARLKADLSSVRSETIALRLELVRANQEIARVKDEATHGNKLDDILALLKERPTVVVSQGTVQAPSPLTAMVDDVPMYIPSQIKSDANEESRVIMKEESTSSSTLSDASRALREKRKRQE